MTAEVQTLAAMLDVEWQTQTTFSYAHTNAIHLRSLANLS